MRTDHSMKNITINFLSQIIIILLGFISRKVFIDSLNIEYLGINGLLTNVISMMALVEGGIGISIVYNLYKPLADNDQKKVIALVQLYKKLYGILALIMFILSLCLYPFFDSLIKDADTISNIGVIYFLFVGKTIVTYLNAHKWSLINADQKGYVLAKVNLIFQIVTTIAKIIILILTKSFILYLVIEFLLYALQTLINGNIVDKRYPYIKTKEKYKLDNATLTNIKENVKALFLHNFGGFIVFGTDNILISSFIGIAMVGLYSNYTMITQQLTALVGPILGGIGASVGNLIATEGIEKNYSIFKISYLINFWVYSICVIFLYNVLEPFINWWLGDGYLLGNWVFIFILVNMYLNGMRTTIQTFKNKAGLFKQDKFAPVIEGLINIVASLILLQYFGLLGIFVGTILSTLLTVFWTQPVIVFKHLFKRPVFSYFATYMFFSLLTIFTCLCVSIIIGNFITGNSFIQIVFKGSLSLVIPNIFYLVIFYKTKEFKYIKNIMLMRLKKSKVNKNLVSAG